MNDFQRVKDGLDLRDFIARETNGIIQGQGERVQLKECPFCRHHGCFSIWADHYHCFQCGGAEEKHGDVFQFVENYRRLDKSAALKYVADVRGMTLESLKPEDPAVKARKAIFDAAADYYHGVLFSEAASAAFHYQTILRGHSPDVLRRFSVGFSDGNLHRHLSGGFSPDEQIAAGLSARDEAGELRDKFPAGYFIYPHQLPSGGVGDFTCKPSLKGRHPLRLQSEYRLPGCLFFNQKALQEKRCLLVEGQNDLLTVADLGEFGAVAATCGALTEAQISFLGGSFFGKELYLAFDADEAGRNYTRKLQGVLSPMPPKLVHVLSGKSCSLKSVSWHGIAKDVDEFLRAEKEPKDSLERIMREGSPLYKDLHDCLRMHHSFLKERDIKFADEQAKDQAEIIFEWFGGKTAFFVQKGGDEQPFLTHGNRVYSMGKEENGFLTLMWDVARIVPSERKANVLFDSLESLVRSKATRIQVSPWLFAPDNQTIYLHTSRPDDILLKITPGSVVPIPNARECLLRPADKMEPLDFDPHVNVEEAFADLQRFFLGNLSTLEEHRYFVLCWLMNVFLLGYTRDRALLVFNGGKNSGKTTGANLCSFLIYGQDWVGRSMLSSDFADGSVNPLTIKDNLENEHVEAAYDFLISAATGTVKQKRKSSTDSGNVYERLYNQVLITAIEPLGVRGVGDLPRRIWTVQFLQTLQGKGFQKTIAFESLRAHRSKILSALLLVLARDILPTFHERRRFWLHEVENWYPDHPKLGLKEFLGGIGAVLEVLVRYIKPSGRHGNGMAHDQVARDMLREMLKSQQVQEAQAESDQSHVLTCLDLLKDHLLYAKNEDDFRHKFKIHFESPRPDRIGGGFVQFRGTATQFFSVFGTVSKDPYGKSLFTSPAQLGARINDSSTLLANNGWETGEKKRNGRKEYVFTFNEESIDGEDKAPPPQIPAPEADPKADQGRFQI